MAKGFNRQPGGMPGGGGGMMQQIKKMQEQLAAAQASLAEETVTASAGGGAIKVTMTGDQRCMGVEIDPDLLKDADAEMLQDLVLSAVNLALDQSRDLAEKRLGPLAGGLSGLGL
ncbi:MAG: YbaB/EbfC family nucleoid-associated protein [Anaerolineaceae bacterium]|nr:YbaB/EbfC family nucleoid-associated protein [Anaerolineaceae bacterium]